MKKRTVSAWLMGLCFACSALSQPLVSADDGLLTYRMTTDSDLVITEEALAEQDVTLHVALMIENDPGTAAIQLTLAADDGLVISGETYSDPYCYGNGDSSKATSMVNEEKHSFTWISSNSGGLYNEVIYDAALPFAEFDVTVPQGTEAGYYEVYVLVEDILLESGKTTPTSRTSGYVEGVTFPQALEVEYVGLTIQVGNPVMTGDVNQDGFVDSDDAVLVLRDYVNTMLGAESFLDENQIVAADVDGDGFVDSDDASLILTYYATALTGEVPSWEDLLS